ncbi:MAG: ABC transporter ATP-binding protein [Chloroflexi bacterium]|nr:MAG: ABC transporter ATP-binding protein [Chloroflexota bacterium]
MNTAGERGAAPTIKLEALTKFYGPNRGVEDLTLDVRAGEVLGFLGPNGAGKTTALRLLMGLLRPTSGSAEVMGFDSMRESVEVRRRVGYLPGDPALYSNRNGNELLKLAMRTRGLDHAPLAEQLIETLNAPMERDIRKCSRGMRQKVALVLALGHDPEVLVLDEPTTGLDPLGQRAMLSFLRERAEAGRTVLLSSHILSEVEQVCERVAILREGKLKRLDTVEALREEKFRQVTVDFDGDPPSFEGAGDYEVISQEARRMVVRVRGDARELLSVLAAAQITDVSIMEPSLEEVFLEYYRDGGSP